MVYNFSSLSNINFINNFFTRSFRNFNFAVAESLFYNSRRSLDSNISMTGRSSDGNSDTITVLTERLKKAEKRLNLLTCEISSIKSELLELRGSGLSIDSNTRQYSTTPVRKTLSEADGLNHEYSKRPRYEFTKENDYVVVFTDGACENNGKFNAKAGIGVWFGYNHPLNISQPVNGRATNNTAEIQACIRAVEVAYKNGITKLKIKTDSQFVINSMTQWIKRWKKNNWKVASGGDVKNKEDFVILDEVINRLEHVAWDYVEGHAGIDGNEEADRLARTGALFYK